VYQYPLTGNYHEYAYGPVIHPNGDMTVTLNVAFGPEGLSGVPWRGWMLQIKPDGTVIPFAAGMRSPAGIGLDKAGELFYSDNQGDWVGSGRITHVEKGDFTGNPGGLRWATQPQSPVKVRAANIASTGRPMHEVAKEVPGLKPPAIWFPHGIMGNSTSGILLHTGKANMGPFADHLFVGDQAQSRVMRATLEKVNGVYQGACYPFREGFSSGVLRQDWGNDGSMYVGMTSRGWASTGKEEYALQRLTWNGKLPFEMHTVTAKPDGFELLFTKPVDKALARQLANYAVASFTYKYHKDYGSPVINQAENPVRAAVVSEDGMRVRLVVDNLRLGYIHEIKLKDLTATDRTALLHNVAYYTLNQLPTGEKLNVALAPVNHAHHSMAGKGTKTHPATAPKKGKGETVVPQKEKRLTEQPADWPNGPEQTIILGTNPGLKFDKTTLTVKAGSRIKLVFNNTDDMQHNFVLVQPGKANEVGSLALALGLKGPEKNYVPDTPLLLYHTGLLQPTTAETIYFTAPNKPGEYPYVCTYPGHYTVMRGILKVTQ
jgi:azurin